MLTNKWRERDSEKERNGFYQNAISFFQERKQQLGWGLSLSRSQGKIRHDSRHLESLGRDWCIRKVISLNLPQFRHSPPLSTCWQNNATEFDSCAAIIVNVVPSDLWRQLLWNHEENSELWQKVTLMNGDFFSVFVDWFQLVLFVKKLMRLK